MQNCKHKTPFSYFGKGCIRQRANKYMQVSEESVPWLGLTKAWVWPFRMAENENEYRPWIQNDRWGTDGTWHPRWWWKWCVALRGGGAVKSGVGPLPWLWGRKWCLKGEVGRESLFLEPTLLLHREEQSFCMPVRASAGREGVRQGTKPQDQAAEVDDLEEEIEGEKVRDKRNGRYTGIKCWKEEIKNTSSER